MNNLTDKKYAEINTNGIKITDEETKKVLQKKKLSASLVTGVLDCPARWVSGTLLRKFIEEDQDNALTRGSYYHRIMEKFFELDNTDRTKEKVYELINTITLEKEFNQFAHNVDAKTWVKQAIDNYYAMGSVPEKIRIADFQGKPGLEFFVEGNIPGCSRKFLGYIDRLVYDNNNDLVIDDWKTGAKSKKYGGGKNETGWAEARQQILYSQIVNQNEPDKTISKARLIFPVAKDIVNVDINDDNLVNKAINDTVKAEKKYNKMVEENNFDYNPSFLCHWCPLAKVCPKKNPVVRKVEKARLAYESQPTPEELSVGLKIIGVNHEEP